MRSTHAQVAESKDPTTPSASDLSSPDSMILRSINEYGNYLDTVYGNGTSITRDLLKTLLSAPNTNWVGVVVLLEPYKMHNSDLRNLSLNGINFTSSSMTGVDTEEKAQEDLVTWYGMRKGLCSVSHIGNFNIEPLVSFDDTSLTGATCENLFCASFSFKRAILTKAIFASSIVTGASFDEARLEGANFLNCYGGSFSKCDEIVTSFRAANLTKARLVRSNFKGALFSSALLDGADLGGSYFKKASFEYSQMEGANLILANCSYANFHAANLKNALLTGADLRGANFKYANMQGARLHGAKFDLFEQFSEIQISSFYYPDEAALDYINAIYAYMKDNKSQQQKNPKTFQRGFDVIASFLAANFSSCESNKVLAGFLLYGKLPGEGYLESMWNTSDDDPGSLRARLKKVQQRVREKARQNEQKEQAEGGTELHSMTSPAAPGLSRSSSRDGV
ncbi:MAG TPA: pentapeptide repeat-containing protein [Gammaproteobacteria bacterium]|nr:pentapeptide repeat-containing protein [Gammaproteobacteria bacterium]